LYVLILETVIQIATPRIVENNRAQKESQYLSVEFMVLDLGQGMFGATVEAVGFVLAAVAACVGRQTDEWVLGESTVWCV
jgi:hypothetical protein